MSKNSSLMMACEPGAYFSGEGAGERQASDTSS